MRSRWGESLAIALLMLLPGPALAQGREIGVGGIATLSDPAFAAGSAYVALRTSGRTRVSGSLSTGVSSREFAWRGELLGHFLLSPEERRKAGFYIAAGAAVVDGPAQEGYLVVTLGLESRPRGPSGWAVEAGVGGGVRLAAGYRWRWFPHPSR